MNNGLKATIIKYRGAHDMDVQFEDGAVHNNVSYSAFNSGRISHPDDIVEKVSSSNSRLHESRVMNNGMQATIIAYNSSQDIDVQFEDGTVREGITYARFKCGSVATYSQTANSIKQQRLGEIKIMNDGECATIIKYISNKNMDVQFNDGVIIKNVKYLNFKKGNIRHPKNSIALLAEKRIGETRVMGCGMKATIVAYRSSSDIDVEFEDKTTQLNVRYSSFKSGQIAHPTQTNKYHKATRLGERKIMNNGLEVKIIKYNSCEDIDVQFEDGAIRHGVKYYYFKNGSIAHPNETSESKAESRIGEKKMMNCGDIATIINYRKSNDIDVQFEDGAIAEHKAYSKFQKGCIGHPE